MGMVLMTRVMHTGERLSGVQPIDLLCQTILWNNGLNPLFLRWLSMSAQSSSADCTMASPNLTFSIGNPNPRSVFPTTLMQRGQTMFLM
jgi:hypothetical protein